MLSTTIHPNGKKQRNPYLVELLKLEQMKLYDAVQRQMQSTWMPRANLISKMGKKMDGYHTSNNRAKQFTTHKTK